MKLPLALVGTLLILVPLPRTGRGQSLGEVARQCRKEREARLKMGEVPVKVFTNDDIARIPPGAILESSMQEPSSSGTKPSTSSQPPGAALDEMRAVTPSAPSDKDRSRGKSKEYWQAQFKAKRTRLAHAKEEQTLVEDELRLLQIQQARELNPERSRKLNGRIDATTVELEAKRATTEKARQAMEKLQKEFTDSGAPREWIQKETTSDQ